MIKFAGRFRHIIVSIIIKFTLVHMGCVGPRAIRVQLPPLQYIIISRIVNKFLCVIISLFQWVAWN